MKCWEFYPRVCIHNTYFLLNVLMAPISSSVFSGASLSRLSKWHALAYCALSWVRKNMKSFEYCPREHIHNTYFLQNVQMAPISSSIFSGASLSRLSKWHALAYWALSWVTNKMKFCEYCPRVHIHFLQNLQLAPISSSVCTVASLSRLSKWHTLAYSGLS